MDDGAELRTANHNVSPFPAPYSSDTLIEKITPLKRMGTSNDIADLVNFLTSEKSSYITGTIIPVDGGLRLVGQEQIAKMFKK